MKLLLLWVLARKFCLGHPSLISLSTLSCSSFYRINPISFPAAHVIFHKHAQIRKIGSNNRGKNNLYSSKTKIPSCLWNVVVCNMERDWVQNPVVRKEKKKFVWEAGKSCEGEWGGASGITLQNPLDTHSDVHRHTRVACIFPTEQPTALCKGWGLGWGHKDNCAHCFIWSAETLPSFKCSEGFWQYVTSPLADDSLIMLS